MITISEFNYVQVNSTVAEFLKEKSIKISSIVERVHIELGRELKEAQDELASHGYGCFEEWYESFGLKKRTVYNYINAYSFVQRLHNQGKEEIANNIPAKLMYEAGKPNADPEIVQAVIEGKVTSQKQFKQLEKIKEDLDKQDEIKNVKKVIINQDVVVEATIVEEVIVHNTPEEQSQKYDDLILNIADCLQNLIKPFKKLITSEKLTVNKLIKVGALTSIQQEQLIGVLVKDNISDMFFPSYFPLLIKLALFGTDSERIVRCSDAFGRMFGSDMSIAFDVTSKITDEVLEKVKTLELADVDYLLWDVFSNLKSIRDNEYKQFKTKYGSGTSGSAFDETVANTTPNAYKVLGVTENSTQEEIKRNFSQLIKIFHPDTARVQGIQGTEYLCQLIKEAYDAIKKPKGEN